MAVNMGVDGCISGSQQQYQQYAKKFV